jgi:hypothetical protein
VLSGENLTHIQNQIHPFFLTMDADNLEKENTWVTRDFESLSAYFAFLVSDHYAQFAHFQILLAK